MLIHYHTKICISDDVMGFRCLFKAENWGKHQPDEGMVQLMPGVVGLERPPNVDKR